MRRDEALRIISEKEPVLRNHGVASLSLFGSVARDEAGPESDVDLLVEFDGRPVGIFAFLRLKGYLEDIFGRPVDLVSKDAIKRQLRERILSEAVRAA